MKKKKKHNNHPITTVTQCRVPIFWPTNKPPRSSKTGDLVIQNNWGRATIKNCKLTQIHRNLLDVMFAYYDGIYFYDDGAVGLLIDLYSIQTMFGIMETNHTWLIQKFEELRQAPFITETKNWVVNSGIVRKHRYSKIEADHTEDKFGENKLYLVVLESEFMKFFKVDTNLFYAKLITKILKLKYAQSQALARFCLSHKKVNLRLETILESIGVFRSDLDRPRKSKLQKEIMEDKQVLLEEFGIDIRPMKKSGKLGVFYKKHKDVWFKNQENQENKPPQ